MHIHWDDDEDERKKNAYNWKAKLFIVDIYWKILWLKLPMVLFYNKNFFYELNPQSSANGYVKENRILWKVSNCQSMPPTWRLFFYVIYNYCNPFHKFIQFINKLICPPRKFLFCSSCKTKFFFLHHFHLLSIVSLDVNVHKKQTSRLSYIVIMNAFQWSFCSIHPSIQEVPLHNTNKIVRCNFY